MISKNGKIISKKEKLKERINFFINFNRNYPQIKKAESYPCFSNNENTIPKNSIRVQKLIKNSEPLIRVKNFEKISPKFNPLNDEESNLDINDLNHRITQSDLELLKIDEKISVKNLEQIEYKSLSQNNLEKTFPFHFLTEIEKCYQEISKDLKGNGKKNLEYKIRISANYLKIILNEENIMYKYFLTKKDFNKFFTIELCIFLTVFFLNDFSELNDYDIADLNNCITFAHLNFLFIMMILINKTSDDIYDINNNLNNNSINYSFLYYQKCKTIIELNKDKIDEIKMKNNFSCHNKIIKNILFNLLMNLSYNNKSITDNIFNIYYSWKKNNFIDIIHLKIKNDELINQKINLIFQESHSPEELIDPQLENSQGTIPNPPFLPPKKENDLRDYCLVLDLDETLVHYFEDETEAYVKVRMGTEKFIKELSVYCEICIFTASTKFYADTVINGLSNHNLIDYRLYRQHTSINNGVNIKDLSKLGRNLEKIIIVDNIEENYQLQPDNGINISDFEGDENDNELEYLLEDLLEVVREPGKNVKDELHKVRRNMQKRYTNLS
jgi:Dullard-like phosphatase family protein